MYEGNQWKRNIDISYIDYGIDILYNNNRLYILEGNNIFEIDEYGKIHNIYSLPAGVESYQVKGLSVNGKNKVVIQSEKFEYEIDTHKKTAGYSFNGIDKKLTTEFIDSKNEEIIDFEHNKKYSITFAEKSGCIHLVGVDKKGNIYITVEEDIPSSLVLVEHTIRMITPDGRQFYARVPLEEYYNFPKRFINVTKDGEVYITVQKEKKVEFYKVTLGKKYDSKIEQLKEKAKEFKEKYKDTVSILGPIGDVIPRSEVEKRADAMINLEWEYRYENSVISNPNVKKPKHLAKITSFPSSQIGIPYCWGGFDGIDTSSSSSWSNFVDAMSKGKFAGNVNTQTSGWQSGTAGLDCSGFVSAAYAFKQKQGTWGFDSLLTKIDYNNVVYMDVFNKPGSHILLFDRWNSDRTVVYSKESTIGDKEDKAQNYQRTRSWLQTNGYYAGTLYY